MRVGRKDLGVCVLIALLIPLFFPEMLSLSKGFFSGDHRAQHYPWAYFYDMALSKGRLPWWSPHFHLGFPLLAEGQVGALYFLNFIFYFLLPFKIAYSYGILFHYILSGIFFYLFMRNNRVGCLAAVFSVLIYLFGTAQGGYYYNIISMKVLTWFPLTLLLCDRITSTKRKIDVLWLALVFSFQWTAGYLQYAVYSIFFSCSYFTAKLFMRAEDGVKPALSNIFFLIAACLISMIIALPQLGATLELASFSNRFSYPEEFAFVGSVNPLAIATFYFPHWDGFLGSELYSGALGMAFICVSLFTKKLPKEKLFYLFFIVTLLLALGKYNPLYYMLIKLTHFSSLRVPAKFLYFTATAAAVIAGYGFDRWLSGEIEEKKTRFLKRLFLWLSAVGGAGLVLSHLTLTWFQKPIYGILKKYIEGPFMSSPVHTKSLEVYMGKLDGFYQTVTDLTKWTDSWNLIFLLFVAVSALIFKFAISASKKNMTKWALLIFVCLGANLYVFGWTSVKGNYEASTYLDSKNKITEYLQNSDGDYRVHRLVSDIKYADQFSFIPHMNMVNNFDIVGGYSPLITAKVFEYLDGIGDIDDSHEFKTADWAALGTHLESIQRMNVKYVISMEPTSDQRFKEVLRRGDEHLYEVKDYLPRVYLRSLEAQGEVQAVNVEKYSSQLISGSFQVDAPGMLIFSELNYPGWKVTLNGESVNPVTYDSIYRAVSVNRPGKYTFVSEYKPVWKRILPYSVVLALLCFVIPFAGVMKESK